MPAIYICALWSRHMCWKMGPQWIWLLLCNFLSYWLVYSSFNVLRYLFYYQPQLYCILYSPRRAVVWQQYVYLGDNLAKSINTVEISKSLEVKNERLGSI